MKYFVTVDGRTLEVELTADGARVGEEVFAAEVATVPRTALRHLRLGDRGVRLTALRVEGGWRVRMAGREATVEVEDQRTHALRELAGGLEAGKGPRLLRAPMPGLVVRVEVEPGQEVEAGDGLVVMEAMKMENELSADAQGTVTAVEVEEGQTVEQNDVLVRYE